MDLEPSWKTKLAYFRIKELKDVLSQLGLAKQGKKQELVVRISAVFSDEHGPSAVSQSHGVGKKNSIGKEGAARIIDDIYRKMRGSGATDLSSKSHSSSDIHLVKPKDEVSDPRQLVMKVRCPCDSLMITDSMIKCEDSSCHVWQHIACVIIPGKPMDGVLPKTPSKFYCDLCRIKRADPYWVTIGHPLLPLMLTSSGTAGDGSTTSRNTEQIFSLSRADRAMLNKDEYDLQAWCILLNDTVPFRMHWPLQAELLVNGVSCRLSSRPGSHMLGPNGRDDVSGITSCCREGINRIRLSTCDTRVFCFGIRVAKKRSFSQVFSLIPKEADGESLEDALTRVRRCIGGGTTQDYSDDDNSDLEVVADSLTWKLRCPVSGLRIRVAGRFRSCVHMGCFDLETFVVLNERARKWLCPMCPTNDSVDNLIIDPFFNRITSMMRNCTEDVDTIEIKPDGSWRVKNVAASMDLSQWHLPDGSIPTSNVDVKLDLDALRWFKQEVSSSEGHTGLKIGIKKNPNGMWQVSKPGDLPYPSSRNQYPNVLPLSSSGTGSYLDDEDASVNQDEGHFDFSVCNGHEHNSFSPNSYPPYNAEDRITLAPSKDADIVVLSDSEEDIVAMTSPENGCDTVPAALTGNLFPANQNGFSESLPGDVGLFNSNSEALGAVWPLQNDPGFELFTTDATDGLYSFASDGDLGDGLQLENTETDVALLDNPLAFGLIDPSLQIFLPTLSYTVPLHADLADHTEIPNGRLSTLSSTVPLHADLADHTEIPNGRLSDGCISLNPNGGGNHGDLVLTNEVGSGQQVTSKEDGMDLSADASLLPSENDESSKKATPNSKRVHIPRFHLSMLPVILVIDQFLLMLKGRIAAVAITRVALSCVWVQNEFPDGRTCFADPRGDLGKTVQI